MKTAETFTLVLNTSEYCTIRLALEKFEFFHTDFDKYKSIGEIRAELDLDATELKTLRDVLDRFEALV